MSNFFNFRCFVCQKSIYNANNGICTRCVARIKQEPYCGRCGAKLTSYELGCGKCVKKEILWHKTVKLSGYDDPIKSLIHCLKFSHKWYLDELLSRQMVLAYKKARQYHRLEMPDVIMPVPLHRARFFQRGFNQSEVVAKKLARYLDIDFDNRSLMRIKNTRYQRELKAEQRVDNVRNSFTFTPLVQYQSVAIFDDVITTGATMNAICKELRKNGVIEIQVWTLARV